MEVLVLVSSRFGQINTVNTWEGAQTFETFSEFNEISLPANPSANVGRFYAKDVAGITTPEWLDSAGTETSMIGGGGGGQTFARIVKTADQTVTSSTVLVDDDELLFTPAINKEYGFVLFLLYDADTTPDMKSAFTLPSGASGLKGTNNDTGANNTEDVTTATVSSGFTGQIRTSVTTGQFTMGGTAGNIILQWAQNTSDAAGTIMKTGSYFVIWEEV